MTAVPGSDPDELRRLIEERLGPIHGAEIEAHVESCRTGPIPPAEGRQP